MIKKKLPLVLKILAAIILFQTLYFKFTGHPDSVHIFSAIGMEPYGRIGTGMVELIAATLLLIPKTAWLGSVIAIGLMTGAIFFHLTVLGLVVNHDGGLLFTLAMVVLITSIGILLFERKNIPFIGKNL